jgi:Domain of unknown function (DUF4333)
MNRKHAAVGALVLAAVTVAATGCGDVIDSKKIENQLKSQVEAAGIKLKSVSCPDNVDAKAGQKFNCTVTTAKGTEVKLNGEVKNDKGLVDFNSADLQKLGATGGLEQSSP